MERPSRQLLLSELRVRSTAYDVSLGRSLLTWKRRISSPVYHPFRPSKTRTACLCLSCVFVFTCLSLCLSACVSVGLKHTATSCVINKGQRGQKEDMLDTVQC